MHQQGSRLGIVQRDVSHDALCLVQSASSRVPRLRKHKALAQPMARHAVDNRLVRQPGYLDLFDEAALIGRIRSHQALEAGVKDGWMEGVVRLGIPLRCGCRQVDCGPTGALPTGRFQKFDLLEGRSKVHPHISLCLIPEREGLRGTQGGAKLVVLRECLVDGVSDSNQP